jgi:hypothetical protein
MHYLELLILLEWYQKKTYNELNPIEEFSYLVNFFNLKLFLKCYLTLDYFSYTEGEILIV